MQIKIGETYVNKTWKYLVPYLRDLEVEGHKVLRHKLNSVSKLAVGVHDTLLDGSTVSEQRMLYILLDSKYRENQFWDFISWFRQQPYYVGDYLFGYSIDSRKYMINMKIPEKYYHAYDMFIQGKYSEMYTSSQVEKLIDDVEIKDILLKRPFAMRNYIQVVKEQFDVDIKYKDIPSTQEYDLPLRGKEEIFNFVGDIPYFVTELKNKIEI